MQFSDCNDLTSFFEREKTSYVNNFAIAPHLTMGCNILQAQIGLQCAVQCVEMNCVFVF